MALSTAKKAVDLLLTGNDDNVNLDFYGGEPFLCFDLMKSVITYSTSQAVKLQKKISKKALQAGYLQNFTKLCLGNVNDSPNVSELLVRAQQKRHLYAQFQDELGTLDKKCSEYDFVLICNVCPADALVHSIDGHTIPKSTCEINKLKHSFRQLVREQIYNRDKKSVWNIVDWPTS